MTESIRPSMRMVLDRAKGKADCGDNSCRYAEPKTGMRTNGGCHCDMCPLCGTWVRPDRPTHRSWCSQPSWLPKHHIWAA